MLSEKMIMKDLFNLETYCALSILTELGDQYHIRGCTLEEISEKHYMSVSYFENVAVRLEAAGLIRIERKDKKWMYLMAHPDNLFISDIMNLFYIIFSE